MTSFRTIIIIKMITLWNYLNDITSYFTEECINFFEYIKNYIYGYNNTWLFIHNHTIPITLANVNNLVEVNWIYNKTRNNLYFNTIGTTEEIMPYNFPWLSAKIKITDSVNNNLTEYNIDNFLETFKIFTNKKYIPSLHIIFMSWCAFNKYWFKTNDIIKIEFIDDMGDSNTVNINDNNYKLDVKRNKIYIVDSIFEKIDVDTEQHIHIDNNNSQKNE